MRGDELGVLVTDVRVWRCQACGREVAARLSACPGCRTPKLGTQPPPRKQSPTSVPPQTVSAPPSGAASPPAVRPVSREQVPGRSSPLSLTEVRQVKSRLYRAGQVLRGVAIVVAVLGGLGSLVAGIALMANGAGASGLGIIVLGLLQTAWVVFMLWAASLALMALWMLLTDNR